MQRHSQGSVPNISGAESAAPELIDKLQRDAFVRLMKQGKVTAEAAERVIPQIIRMSESTQAEMRDVAKDLLSKIGRYTPYSVQATLVSKTRNEDPGLHTESGYRAFNARLERGEVSAAEAGQVMPYVLGMNRSGRPDMQAAARNLFEKICLRTPYAVRREEAAEMQKHSSSTVSPPSRSTTVSRPDLHRPITAAPGVGKS